MPDDEAPLDSEPISQGQPSPQTPLAIPVVSQIKVTYSAPLPPPAMLEHYERILPGAAERIFGQWERQSSHRQDIEKLALKDDSKHQSIGQHYAFILSALVILGSLILIWQGKSMTGLILILGNLVTLAGMFVYGRYSSEQGRKETARLLTDALKQLSTLEDEDEDKLTPARESPSNTH
jgi:uncharacterized membrane protein